MRFYTKQHQFYCGIDLHTKKMRIPMIPTTQSGGKRPLIPIDSGHRFRRKRPPVPGTPARKEAVLR